MTCPPRGETILARLAPRGEEPLDNSNSTYYLNMQGGDSNVRLRRRSRGEQSKVWGLQLVIGGAIKDWYVKGQCKKFDVLRCKTIEDMY